MNKLLSFAVTALLIAAAGCAARAQAITDDAAAPKETGTIGGTISTVPAPGGALMTSSGPSSSGNLTAPASQNRPLSGVKPNSGSSVNNSLTKSSVFRPLTQLPGAPRTGNPSPNTD